MKFRKKPVVVEAVQWTGDAECLKGTPFAECYHGGMVTRIDKAIPIRTLKGEMRCAVGDFLIQGVKGELYPCNPDTFAATYEPVEDETLLLGAETQKAPVP